MVKYHFTINKNLGIFSQDFPWVKSEGIVPESVGHVLPLLILPGLNLQAESFISKFSD